jgi:hypothetical protein
LDGILFLDKVVKIVDWFNEIIEINEIMMSGLK